MNYFEIEGIEKNSKMYKGLMKEYNNLAKNMLREAKAIPSFLEIANDTTLTDEEKIRKMYHLNQKLNVLVFNSGTLKKNAGYWCELKNYDFPELKKLSSIRVTL